MNGLDSREFFIQLKPEKEAIVFDKDDGDGDVDELIIFSCSRERERERERFGK